MLPSLDTTANDQTISAIDKLGKAIMEKASMSIQGATKAIVPNIPKMIDQLTLDLEKGPINSFGRVIKKLESMVQSLGLDLREYNQDLAKLLQDREEKAVKSEAAVQRLREQGIVARVNATTKEVKILSKHEIKQEEKAIKLRELKITKLELQLKRDAHKLQTRMFGKDEDQATTKKNIQENSVKLEELKALQDQKQTEISTNTVDTGRSEKGLPAMLEMMKDGFLEPFRAVGESFGMMKDMGKGTLELVNFFSGGLFLKAFKGITKGLKAISGFFTLARLVLVAKFALVIGAITFVAAKINKIKDFFVGIIDYFRNSKLGKLLGLSKETPEEKEERKIENKNRGTSMVDVDSHYDSFPTVPNPNDVDKNVIKGSNDNVTKITNEKIFNSKTTQNDAVKEFEKLSKEANDQISKSSVIINNAPTSVQTNNSGSVTSGFTNNNPDETITNTSRARWSNM